MGASIFVGQNNNKQRESTFKFSGSFVNGQYWDAFGDFLDEVLLPNYPKLHEIIKSEEGYYLKFYSFVELNQEDFNRAVNIIRQQS